MPDDAGRVRLARPDDLDALQGIEAAADTLFEPLMDITGWGPPPTGAQRPVLNPATQEVVAQVTDADAETVARAIADAAPWDAPAADRAAVLRAAADLYERNFGEIFAALAREAGKTLPDAVGELREAVDFLLYYAAEGENDTRSPRGIFAAISP